MFITKSDSAVNGECMFNSQSTTRISVPPNFKDRGIGKKDFEVNFVIYIYTYTLNDVLKI